MYIYEHYQTDTVSMYVCVHILHTYTCMCVCVRMQLHRHTALVASRSVDFILLFAESFAMATDRRVATCGLVRQGVLRQEDMSLTFFAAFATFAMATMRKGFTYLGVCIMIKAIYCLQHAIHADPLLGNASHLLLCTVDVHLLSNSLSLQYMS